jgi:SNF2 family DNA or RNA helicase
MSAKGAWWEESEPGQAPQRRRFGVFSAPIPRGTDLPKRLSIPAPVMGAPGRRTAAASSLEEASTLAPAGVSVGHGRLVLPVAGAMGTAASVYLLPDRIVERAGSASSAARRESPPPDRPEAPDEMRAVPPLWKRLRSLLQPSVNLLLSQRGPIEWPGSFFDYQLDGVRALLSTDALLLADDMGLGKTVQAIAALRVLALRGEAERALLVVPASLILQWRRAISQWAPELRVSTVRGPQTDRAWQWATPAHLYVTSYETLREDFTSNPQSPPRRVAWDVVVIDEAQKIKNREADVSRKCKLLPRRRAWALTGTPVENSVEDLVSILEFVQPLEAGAEPERLVAGPALTARHRTVQLRRKKHDVLPQLPPKLVADVMLAIEGAQRQAYERAERDGVIRLREQGDAVRIESVLELILRLKQICNFCPATGRSAKMDDLADRVRTLSDEGHRALVFSQFTDERHGVRAIASHLSAFHPLEYTGGLTTAERDRVIEEFKRDDSHRVLVLSLRAGGQGLNLPEASYVFHFDRWWNPAVEHQAEDRSHRLGQEFPVHVFKYLCEDTIEERIDQILRKKQSLFDDLVDDVSLDLSSRLTRDELLSLFEL